MLSETFERAPQALSAKSEDAGDNKRKLALRDSGSFLRISRDRITRAFMQQMTAELLPDEGRVLSMTGRDFSVGQLSLQDPTEIDKIIIVDRHAKRLTTRMEDALAAILPSLERLAYYDGVAINPHAFGPDVFCRSFFEAIDSASVESEQADVLLGLFVDLAGPQVKAMYTAIKEWLDGHDVKPLPTVDSLREGNSTGPVAEPAGGGAGGGGGGVGAGGGGGSAGLPGTPAPQQPFMPIDAATIKALQSIGPPPQQPATAGLAHVAYGDYQLAQELTQLSQGQSVQGLPDLLAGDRLRRAGAIGLVFNEIEANRSIPEVLRPRFMDLRFPVIKTALADPKFFQDKDHAVRKLLTELLQLAANSRISTERGAENISELLEKIRTQFEVSAELARPDSSLSNLVPQSDIDKFISEQKAENSRRRQEVIQRSRELVAEELWLRTAARDLPQSVRRVFAQGWTPMMALRLLRHGASSEEWRDGLELVDQLIISVDPSDSTEVELEPLIERFRDALTKSGMVEARVSDLVATYATAASECEKLPELDFILDDDDEATGGDKPHVDFDKLLAAGQWYKVYDAALGHIRWLRAGSHTEEEVIFVAYDGSTFRVPRAQFLDDLIAARSEPVDPTPSVEQIIQTLQAA